MKYVKNEKDVVFELDKATTLYAISKGLMDVQVLFATESNGNRTRLIVENGEAVHEDKNLEAIAVRLDMMAADRSFP